MELNSFSIFLTVVEEMNFTRAAEKLYMTQQSLSGHIKRLENIYGVTLFQRRPVLKLTQEGEVMAHFARQMLQSESNMQARFADISQDCQGFINLGMAKQRSQVFFPGIWSSFHQAHPNISVRIHERMTLFLLEELQMGTVDLFVGNNIPRSSGLELTPLAEEYNCCLINELLLQKYFPHTWEEMLERFAREGVNLLELKNMPMVVVPEHNAIRRLVDQIFYKAHAMPNVVLETNEQSVIFNVACFGDGVGIINSATIFSRMNAQHTLPPTCHIFKLVDLPRNQLALATRTDVELPGYVDELKKAIVDEFHYYVTLLEKIIP